MLALRIGLLSALCVVVGCDTGEAEDIERRAPELSAPSAPKPVAAPAIEAAEPAPAATQQGEGECATSDRCAAAASKEERQGHIDRAAPLYERACDLGSGQACYRIGELYRDGKGVAPDDDRARALFEQGCRQGSNAACDALGH